MFLQESSNLVYNLPNALYSYVHARATVYTHTQPRILTDNCMLRCDTGPELDKLRKVASNRDEWRTLCHRAT